MDIIKLDSRWDLICESGRTSTGFFHKVSVMLDGSKIVSRKVNYINRTWERYTFETAMKNAIRFVKDKELRASLETAFNNWEVQRNGH